MYPVNMKQPRHAKNFQTSLDLYLVHLRLRKYLEIFPEEFVPPPGITGTQQHHHLLDKPASLSHTAPRGEQQLVIRTFSCRWPAELPRGAAAFEETSCKAQRHGRTCWHRTQSCQPHQSERCRASRELGASTWEAMRPNCSTTRNTLKSILVTLFVSIYITFWFSK